MLFAFTHSFYIQVKKKGSISEYNTMCQLALYDLIIMPEDVCPK